MQLFEVGIKTPTKLLKNEIENEFRIEMILHARRYSLALDKTRYMSCGICMEICPRETSVRKQFPWRMKN